MSHSLSATLSSQFPQLPWLFDEPLAPYTYFKIGGPADAFCTINTPEDLRNVIDFCHQKAIPVTLLGGASNVIVNDDGVRGVVIRFTYDAIERTGDKFGDKFVVKAGAGIKMALLVKQTLDWHLTGLEYFLGVPGTLGGATYNNAHYLSDLISQHIHRVQILDTNQRFVWLTQKECDFAYDHSRFQTSHEYIVQVEFALDPGNPETSRQLVQKATEYRARTQPLGIPSSGCIFQNTPNTPQLQLRFPEMSQKSHISAGFLIDQAGLKGTKVGPVEVSTIHAAFIVNHGGGTAEQVKTLISLVKTRVLEQFGVNLQEEVFYLG